MCTIWYMRKDSQPDNRSERPSRRSPSRPARDRLLDEVVAHFARHGVGDFSLRGLAAELGTSHRMLIYHFGSKDGLLVEVVRRVEAGQRAAMAQLNLDSDHSAAHLAREFHRHLSAAEHWPARLFFELTGQALVGNPHAVPLLDGIVDAWLPPLTELSRRTGRSEKEARAHARLALAVARGLLFDLLATGDRDAVDAAAEAFLVSYEPVSPSNP